VQPFQQPADVDEPGEARHVVRLVRREDTAGRRCVFCSKPGDQTHHPLAIVTHAGVVCTTCTARVVGDDGFRTFLDICAKRRNLDQQLAARSLEHAAAVMFADADGQQLPTATTA
jgi:hypothetical protein